VITDANELFTYDGLGSMLTAGKKVDSTWVSRSEFAYNDIGKVTDANETLFSYAKKTMDFGYKCAWWVGESREDRQDSRGQDPGDSQHAREYKI